MKCLAERGQKKKRNEKVQLVPKRSSQQEVLLCSEWGVTTCFSGDHDVLDEIPKQHKANPNPTSTETCTSTWFKRRTNGGQMWVTPNSNLHIPPIFDSNYEKQRRGDHSKWAYFNDGLFYPRRFFFLSNSHITQPQSTWHQTKNERFGPHPFEVIASKHHHMPSVQWGI